MVEGSNIENETNRGTMDVNLNVSLEAAATTHVLEFNHYYLIVFELRNSAISVIDNFHESIPLVGLRDNRDYYLKDSPYKVSSSKITHSMGNKKNAGDCAIFVMRHMEKFMGMREQFNCGFSSNGKKKKSQLNLLRKRFVLHLLRSEVNVLRDAILLEARKK
ncbi:hypothetical protein E3N88_23988 [Mikania micrantha]|uniref:Ubiquitin-like protease family profile domain-containing protein n=1 Tax=Mikania micrantha TaxID=192012 RepID=A0A5N6NGX2_9ASTR|nr:hypothetical protein E3N88_23988 [Mikania micrantha]